MNSELERITETALTSNPYAADDPDGDLVHQSWQEPDDAFAFFWFNYAGDGTEVPRVSVFQERDPGQWTRQDWELGVDPESYPIDVGRANARPVGRTDLVRLLIISDGREAGEKIEI